MRFLPFNPTPSFPSDAELAAILAPALPSDNFMLRHDPLSPGYTPARLGRTLRERYPALDAVTLASMHEPRQDGGLAHSLSRTFCPHP